MASLLNNKEGPGVFLLGFLLFLFIIIMGEIMIRICAITKADEVLYDVSLEETKKDHIVWYWLDLYKPTKEEYTYILQDHFKFHPLAIEDCIEYVQRPKVDFYDGYNF